MSTIPSGRNYWRAVASALWLAMAVCATVRAAGPTTFYQSSIPLSGLVSAADGNFYGTTRHGGTNDLGAVFKLTPAGVFQEIYSFAGVTDGAHPRAALVEGTDGCLYGTAQYGGAQNAGTVFKLTTGGIFTTLHSMVAATEGAEPVGGLVFGSDGKLYGTASCGGASDAGTLFQITTAGSFSVLHQFSGVNGRRPLATLAAVGGGLLYGTTESGGANEFGTVFSLTTAGAFTSLFSFGGTNGSSPSGVLVQGADSAFYGTTAYGGTGGFGSAFKITAGGTFTSLYSMTGDALGGNPFGGLALAQDGNFYGSAKHGGMQGFGALFKLTPAGGCTEVASFTGDADGGNPCSTLAPGAGGDLFGTTSLGGNNYGGTGFRLPQPLTLASVTGPAAGSYKAGQALSFTVNFSAAVTVDITGGTPTLPLTIGSSSVNASYASGSGSTALVFTYIVQAGDTDTDGIASTSPLALNGGTIKGGSTDAPLTFTPPDTTTVLVVQPNTAPSFNLRAVTGAQGPWTVSTVAGTAGSSGSVDGTGAAARFNQPFGVAVDGAGNVYAADRFNHTVRKMTAAGVVTTLAGLAGSSGSTDDTGAAARFNGPAGIAVDSAGNLYVGDTGNHTVRKITPGGVVTTLAGTAGSSGTADGTGAAARFNGPAGVAVDLAGNVYVADSNNRVIRKVTAGGVVTTLAGLAGFSGSANGTGAAARFLYPFGVAVDVDGNVYVAELAHHTIRKVTAGGVVTTLAGLAGSAGSADGAGAAARFNQPTALTVDDAGNVFVVDGGNRTVRKITPGGVVTTIAGQVGSNGSMDGVGGAARFSKPYGIAADRTGNLFLAETYYFTLRKLTPATAAAVSIGLLEDAGAQSLTSFATGIAAGPASEAGQTVSFLVSNDNPGLFSVQPAMDATGRFTYTPAAHASGSALVTVIAMDTGGTDNGGVDKSTNTFTLTITAVNDAPTIAFASSSLTVFRNSCPLVSSLGFATITTGPANESGQSITSVSVSNDNPTLFAVPPTLSAGGVLTFTAARDGIGTATVTVIVQDNGGTANGGVNRATNSFTITVQPRNVAPRFELPAATATGPWTATTVAGTAGSAGTAEGTGAAARFNNPFGIAQDSAGNVYVADRVNHTIRQITPAGVVTTLAGSAGVSGSADGIGAAARFNAPAGLAVDRAGNVYVADSNNRTVRMIAPGGAVTTLAGLAGASGSANGTGAAARFLYPFGLALDADGNAYVSDASNRTIRKVTPCGVVTTLAALAGAAGTTDGTGAVARFGNPFGVAVDDAGTVFVADQSSHTIRQITSAGVVTTLAGLAGTPGSADGIGAAARFNKPTAVATDHSGNVYVLDGDNFTVRQIAPGGVVTTVAGLAGTSGSANGAGAAARFNRAYGVLVDELGGLLVADTANHTVRRITPVISAVPHMAVAVNAGAQTVANFVTGIAAGPADEAAQTVSFVVTTDNAGLFSAAPAIASNGTLTFTAAAGLSGSAVVTVVAQDTGGTDNGGLNTSTARKFFITVLP